MVKAATEEAIFAASIKDETDKFFDAMHRRLRATESLGRKAFGRLEDKIKRVGQAAGEAANSTTKGLAAMTLKGAFLGNVLGKSLTSLISLFKDLAAAGIRAFSAILEKGNEINKNLEVAERTFASVFRDPQMGKETIKFLSQVSKQLGINRAQAIEFARSILPRTESTAQFTKVLELTEAQARASGKSLEELGFSVREALAGDPMLLRDRFDLERSQIAKIKELSKELGNAGAFVEVIGEALEKRGIANLEDFADTGAAVRLSFSALADEMTTAFAQPIFVQQTEDLQRLTSAIEEDKGQLISILQNIADVGAKVVQTLTDAALAIRGNVDLDQIEELTLKFSDLFDVVILFTETLVGGAEGAGTSVDSLVGSISLLVDTLAESAEKAASLGTSLRATVSVTTDLVQAYDALKKGDASRLFKNIGQLSQNAFFNQEALTREVKNTESAMDRFNQRLAENRKRQEERAAAAKDAGTVDVEGLDAALTGLQEVGIKAAEAQSAVLKIRQNLSKKFVEDQIKESRRIVDAEIKASRRRENIVRQSAKVLDKIEQDAATAKAKAYGAFGVDVSKFEADAVTERKKIRDEAADNAVEAERQFRQKLQDVQTDFERAARNAALTNDAIAFVSAKIARDDAITDAKKDRSREKDEISKDRDEKVEELAIKLADERAAIDADLSERLRKIDQSARDQADRHADQLREQEEEYRISQERQVDDLALANFRKDEDLKRSLDEQLAQIGKNQSDIEGVTAESLITQAQKYSEVFGSGGTADLVMKEFFDTQSERLADMATQAASLNASISDRSRKGAGAYRTSGGARTSSSPTFRPPRAPRPNRIGQEGLVSQFLTNPQVSVPESTSTTSSTQNVNTRNDASIELDLRGVEPLIQRVAATTALEIVRNVIAGG